MRLEVQLSTARQELSVRQRKAIHQASFLEFLSCTHTDVKLWRRASFFYYIRAACLYGEVGTGECFLLTPHLFDARINFWQCKLSKVGGLSEMGSPPPYHFALSGASCCTEKKRKKDITVRVARNCTALGNPAQRLRSAPRRRLSSLHAGDR